MFDIRTLTLPFRKAYRARSARQLLWHWDSVRAIWGFPRFASTVTGSPLREVREYCKEAAGLSRDCARDWPTDFQYSGERYNRYNLEALYVLTRCIRPRNFVETGVWRGLSSRYILVALRRNGMGRLHSIDLPTFGAGGRHNSDGILDYSTVNDPVEVGDRVPLELRGNWDLRLGDAKVLLPFLLTELGKIDVFLHDSEHSYDHMTFEYRTAWDHLSDGGWLLSDDVEWSPHAQRAWSEFVQSHGGAAYRYFSPRGNHGILPKGKNMPARGSAGVMISS